MIDTHIHVVPPNLPGVGSLNPVLRTSSSNVAKVIREQMRDAGIDTALAMGSFSESSMDPLGIQTSLLIADQVNGLLVAGIANPTRNDSEFLRHAEMQLSSGRVAAIKIYLGYIHHYPADPGYRPYYEMAERYQIPVIFHTGDTYSAYAKLKFAHPLGIDEVAVDHPKVSFVLAHLGNPWLVDAAEVVYKNVNVWADLSGLWIGQDSDELEPDSRAELIQQIGKAFRYAERPNRFLFGTDWPLAPLPMYRDLIRDAIPVPFHEQVFLENAQILLRSALTRGSKPG